MTLKRGGILLYVREGIPSKIVQVKPTSDHFEGFLLKLILQKSSFFCSYDANKNNIKFHLDILGKALDLLTTRYDSMILMGDFNSEPNEANVQNFLNLYHLEDLIQEKTYFKNTGNPSWIDLILTNCSISF